MLVNTSDILFKASASGYAVGAFNVYNMEGALAVAEASEATCLPAIIQLHPGSLNRGGEALVSLCMAAAESVSTQMSVHLDHCDDADYITRALDMGVRSIMIDGSSLEYRDNVKFTQDFTREIHSLDGFVEAELGRLTGTEDGLTVPEYEEKLTDPLQAKEFVDSTRVDSLAVCVGNVHGKYTGGPNLDFERLKSIENNLSVPLVMHGGSGLPEWMVEKCIDLGVRKFNVNTEVRTAYVERVAELAEHSAIELTDLISDSINVMRDVITSKIKQFAGIIS